MDKKEIKKGEYLVEICVGTLCYIMGGADLQLLEDELPEALRGCVKIKGSQCLELCGKENKPPIVLINNEPMFGATVPSIIKRIQHLENERNGISK